MECRTYEVVEVCVPLLVRVQFSLIVSDGPPCFPHTPPDVNVLEGQNHVGCCKSINNI